MIGFGGNRRCKQKFMVITCDNEYELLLMERRVRGNSHARCEAGEKPETLDTVGLPIAIHQSHEADRR